LTGELVGDQVDGVGQAVGGVARPQRHALQVESGLRDARMPDGGVSLFGQLELEPCHRGDLARDPGESLLDTLPELVVNCEVAALHVDPHPASSVYLGRGIWMVRRAATAAKGWSPPGSARIGDGAHLERAGRAQ